MTSALELEQLHRLERMGWLAAGLTHDLNNALMGTLAEIDVLERLIADARRTIPPGAAPEALEAASRSVANLRAALATTVAQGRELQRVYRNDDAKRAGRPADLRAAVDQAVRLVRPRVRGPIRTELPGGLRVAIDESTVVRVIINLLLNAAEACPSRTPEPGIDVRVGTTGSWSFCDVIDHGPGIAPEVLPRLFEPFVTAKPQGNGTGLGLFVSRHLLRSTGGDLRLLSTSPEGTAFRLLLPTADREA